ISTHVPSVLSLFRCWISSTNCSLPATVLPASPGQEEQKKKKKGKKQKEESQKVNRRKPKTATMRQRDFSLFTLHFSLFTKQSQPPCCPHHWTI
ncbi:MAG: hypothetical protein MR386_07410, partial [Prevotella sp.]|nr:hypothetical protein [Prevotella sp.]